MRHTIATLIALVLAVPALAHDDATLDAVPSPHGGQVRMAGPYHFELVLGEGELRVYLTEHAGQPVSSAGVTGSAVVLSGTRVRVPLRPAGDNALQGSGEIAAAPDMKVVVSLSFPDGKTWQARFTPGDKVQAP